MTEIIPIHPNRLKLIWQSDGADRTKYEVGELVRSEDRVSLSYFRYDSTLINAFIAGYQGYAAFPLNRVVHHDNVIETFSRRLPPRTRTDFYQFLSKNRISPDRPVSDFALLGYTGGGLPSDGFTFAIDWRYQDLPYVFLMEISGFRHNTGMHIDMQDLLGKPVTFCPEPHNQFDPHAVAIFLADIKLGYIPRYYAKEYAFWEKYYRVSAHIERIDGKMARPKVSLIMVVQSPHVTTEYMKTLTSDLSS